MRRAIVILTLPIALAAACGRSRMERDQSQYEVVQEGSASGVTSTIGGAGATPPLTGTNADTTTAFTLDPRLATTPPLQQEGTLAETMPSTVTPSYGSAAPVTPAPQPAPRRTPEPSYTPPPATTPSAPATPAPTSPAPAEPTRPAVPPATDTVAPPPPVTGTPPPTDTEGEATPREKPKPETPAPPPTDTAEPPPPPTRTDTAPLG